jgi:hypothetical protein
LKRQPAFLREKTSASVIATVAPPKMKASAIVLPIACLNGFAQTRALKRNDRVAAIPASKALFIFFLLLFKTALKRVIFRCRLVFCPAGFWNTVESA